MIQTVKSPRLNRKDHVWFRAKHDGRDCYMCCLCGGVTFTVPPDYPTPHGWMPDGYEPLTDAVRKLSKAQPFRPQV